ncbi:MAG: hypothetical protein QF464_02685, partial [Myxococcota bacterium]|nr:hypothetical protein [Myxococcota bacterium]
MNTRHLIWTLASTMLLGACAPGATLEAATFYDPAEIRIEASDWRGERTGVTYLRRTYEVKVDVATDPSRATSRLRTHLVRIAWDTAGPAVISVTTPANARLVGVHAQMLDAGQGRAVRPEARGSAPGGHVPDPDQTTWSLTFPSIPTGTALEVIADFELPGTLATDARWLGAPDGPTAQLLIRYDTPSSANATMQVRGAAASPLATHQEGKQVFAVFLKDVPQRGPDNAHVRYVTRSASVRGHDQRFAMSWSQVAAPYTAALVKGSAALRLNHREPYRPPTRGVGGAEAAYLWVRDRLQRDDALEARWSDGRPLPNLVTTNDLNATDKVHLLRWVLDAAGIAHRVVAVRSTVFAPA